MKSFVKYLKHTVALLILGSAISLLPSCNENKASRTYNPETLVTMRSDTLTMSESENGKLKYKMEAPLMERYELAREPYSEYKMGIYLENYKDSSTVIQSTIRADYAIYYEKRDEWMATGNVVATGEDARTLYTEQLFYNVKTGRVYSNVESRVIQGNDMFIGEGFESDDKFEEWVFRNYTGRMAVNMDEEENNSDRKGPENAEGSNIDEATEPKREDTPKIVPVPSIPPELKSNEKGNIPAVESSLELQQERIEEFGVQEKAVPVKNR